MPEATGSKLPKLLFVCVENACRSQMAEGFAKHYGAGRVAAFSAGARPSGQVNPKAVASMGEIGIDLSAHRSHGLDAVPDGPYAAVVTMGCGDACPQVAATIHEDWALPDPKDLAPADFAAVRDDIGTRVRALLARI